MTTTFSLAPLLEKVFNISRLHLTLFSLCESIRLCDTNSSRDFSSICDGRRFIYFSYSFDRSTWQSVIIFNYVPDNRYIIDTSACSFPTRTNFPHKVFLLTFCWTLRTLITVSVALKLFLVKVSIKKLISQCLAFIFLIPNFYKLNR